MAKRKDSRKQSRQAANGATLRAAVAWILDAKIFAHLPMHGNTAWQAVDLIMLAVVWVWSGDTTLTGAFTEAQRWSMQVLGRSAEADRWHARARGKSVRLFRRGAGDRERAALHSLRRARPPLRPHSFPSIRRREIRAGFRRRSRRSLCL